METGSRLYRSKSDRILCGVSGGLAEYFGVDPALVRLGWPVLTCFTFGAAVLGYIFLCLVVPEREEGVAGASNATPNSSGGPDTDRDKELTDEARVLLNVRQELGPDYDDELLDSFVDRVEERVRSHRSHSKPGDGKESRKPGILPWLLIIAGAVVLAASLDSFSWLVWVVLCPLLLLGAGVIALTRSSSSHEA